ncbi:hypothetical protein FA13DRAFT_1737348 [Coprinellus micaceus]|uniref:Uncharacterized protein n=1 Tax=Coprinellus micaceus TaxID=71717 RepID=A0A4Y7SYW5_COPMI|nr:hypothetical protein FA13DRAFT_1737348 [Coprinellus micaceus]
MPICEECGERVRMEGPQTVEELEAEMAHVDALLQRLATHRSGLRRRINSLAPISRLPPEVLIEILRFSCSLGSSTTPLFLGSICTAWRNFVWTTPTLWARITLQIGRTTRGPRLQAKLPLLPQWLHRAGDLPLHIALFTTEEDDSTFSSLRSVMEILVERSEYWGSIECLLPPQCQDLLLGHRFPLLERAVFRPPIGSISTFSQPPDVFGGDNTPSLCDVDLSGYDFSSMVLPWDQLKRFKTQLLTVTECWELLKRCPQLERCELDHVYCTDNHIHDASSRAQMEKEKFVHQSLEVLNIAFIKGAAITLLDAVSLPSLKELGLHYAGVETVSLLPVVSLVSRSSPTCALRKLAITRSVFGEDDLIRCLTALPGLEELDLRMRQAVPTGPFTTIAQAARQSMTEGFVDLLMLTLDDPPFDQDSVLLPNLKRIHFTGALFCPVSLVLEMLAWRFARRVGDGTGVATLEEATFVLTSGSWCKPLVADIQTMQELREEGLRIQF